MEATAEITAAVKNVPALRFPEFEGEWKDERLGNGVKLISGQHLGPNEYNTEHNGIPYFTGPSDFTNEEFEVTKWTNNSKHFGKNGDVLITVKGSGVGTMTLLRLPKVAMGRQLMAIKSGEFNSEFIYHFLLTKKNLFVALASGNMIPGLSRQDILTLKIKVPTIAEQQKIASFLTIVDDKIQQLSKKKALLEKYKKGVMQQIFSQQIRFKDDNGSDFPKWENVKLGNLAQIGTGSSNREDSGLDSEFTFFDRSQDIRTSSIYLFDGEAVIVAGEGQEFIPKYFVGKFDLHQRTYAIMNFKDLVGKYLFYYIHQFRYYFLNQAVGSTVKSLRLPMFQKMTIKVPALLEQEKIANFLTSIDNKLNYTSKQLEQAKQFKKGLLQQLFV